MASGGLTKLWPILRKTKIPGRDLEESLHDIGPELRTTQVTHLRTINQGVRTRVRGPSQSLPCQDGYMMEGSDDSCAGPPQ